MRQVLRQKLLIFIVSGILIMPATAISQIQLTGFNAGFGWHHSAETYLTVGMLFNKNYHLVANIGGPISLNQYGEEMKNDRPYEWWNAEGIAGESFMKRIELNRIFGNHFALGAGLNFLTLKKLSRYRSTTSDRQFYRIDDKIHSREWTFQLRYFFYDRNVNRDVSEVMPVILGVIVNNRGEVSLDFSLGIM